MEALGPWTLRFESGGEGEKVRIWSASRDWVPPEQLSRVLCSTFFDRVANGAIADGIRTVSVPETPGNTDLSLLSDVTGLAGHAFSAGTLFTPLLSDIPQRKLMPFQSQGVDWLLQHDAGILADDMGLGKTVQAICALDKLVQEAGAVAPALVMAPKSLVLNWVAELYRWAPNLAVNLLMPSRNAATQVWHTRPRTCHVVVTSYDQVRMHHDAVSRIRYSVWIADEAHRLRNRNSALVRSITRIDASRKWMLTGTPVENRTRDLSTLLSVLMPSRFTPQDDRQPPQALRARASSHLLRRTKNEVLTQLPDHVLVDEVVEMAPEQMRAYREVAQSATLNPLTKLGRLLDLCDLDNRSGASGKLTRVEELLAEVHRQGERAIVFSHRLAPLEALQRRLASPHSNLRGVIFSGKLNLGERAAAINSWQASSDTVLLASLKAAGEGLTLTSANWVIFLNRWWNPSANDQARDRIRRIGQTRGTFEVSVRTVGTVEDRLYQLLSEKRELIGALTEEEVRTILEAEPTPNT